MPAERRGYWTKAELALERGHLQTVIRPVVPDPSATAVRFVNALDTWVGAQVVGQPVCNVG